MHVIAVVVAGGAGVDPLTCVAGVPIGVRSVRAVLASGVADRVLLHAPDALLEACVGLPVHAWAPRRASARIGAHAGQRSAVAGGDDLGSPDFLLVHDALRPLTPPALFRAVVSAAREGHEKVVPVLPLPDTVKLVDAGGLVAGTPDRSGLRVVQTPYAVRWDLHGAPGVQPETRAAHTVPGDPLAFAIRTAWDLELAELLVAM